MSAPLSPELLGRLSGWATEVFGLRFPPDRWNELARGFASAALELGIPDLAGWADNFVSGTPAFDHIEAVANHLTISETYFFRHPDTFTLLERQIIPARLQTRAGQLRPLRIWSAGCASGEEPYSIAMQLDRRFPEAARAVILGTDINSHVLERARRGIYTEWSFRDTQDWVKSAYFKRLPNGRFELTSTIRNRVRFVPLNFASPVYPTDFNERADFDLILCRNVLMYFSADWQFRILERLVAALGPDGWLIVGPCDLPSEQAKLLGLQVHGPGLFCKASGRIETGIDLPGFAWPAGKAPLDVETLDPASLPSRAMPPAAPAAVAAPPAPAPQTPVTPEVVTAASAAEVSSAQAQALADRGELEAALAACDQAVAQDKTNPAYHYLRACILMEQDRLPEAEAALRRVLFLEPHSALALFSLGCIADRTGARDEARRNFRLVLELLDGRNRGEALPGGAGLTVGRIQAVVEHTLAQGHP